MRDYWTKSILKNEEKEPKTIIPTKIEEKIEPQKPIHSQFQTSNLTKPEDIQQALQGGA